MTPLIQHEAILASAGSGKTFQLAHRYIRLLAHDVDPNRIIAITFSRKAAGEIFTAIASHLRAAAVSEQEARQTAERIRRPDLRAPDFLHLLRVFLHNLQRLHISTIDSFTVGILRAFPMELGIAPEFDITHNGSIEAEHARTEALTRLFRESDPDTNDKQDLLEAFKQATHGRESKSFAAEFNRFIADYQEWHKWLPDRDAWGQPGRIWPDGTEWLNAPPDFHAALEALKTHTQTAEWKTYAQEKWAEFLHELEAWHPGLPWNRIAYLADRLLAAADQLRNGHIELKISRDTYTPSGPPADWMWTLVRHLMHRAITAALTTTQGIFRLLNRFERHYDAHIRRPGLITFDDALYLIIRGGRSLSRVTDDPTRLHIDFRLDSRLDHWLIDEFQDTSDLQWDVLRNLADEVLQDTEGARSFFFVGDVKQAIYGWRGGNYKLFGEILGQYGNHIHTRPLNTSFRSSQAVLDAVNRVFDHLPDDLPEPVRDQWKSLWGTHTCRTDTTPPPGHMAFLEAGEDRLDQDAVHRACADLLRAMDPLRRGLTTAILVRQNKTAKTIANVIRAACPDIPVSIEGESELADNPVVLLLLALIQYAAHPGDTLAREHLRTSPLGPALFTPAPNPTALLMHIHQAGYQSFLRHWSNALDETISLDAFGRHRLQALLDAAGEFDATGRREPDVFIDHMRAYTFPEQAADSTVRIMSIHKSKGLGFDVVILPELIGSLTAGFEGGIHVARDTDSRPAWALLMPNKSVREQDEILRRESRHAEYNGCFENLCVLYVALTRAKRGLYAIATPPPKKPGALNVAAHLRLQLQGNMGARPTNTLTLNGTAYGVIHESGTRDWYQDKPLLEIDTEPRRKDIPKRFPKKKSKRRRLLQTSPSARAEEPRAAHLLFMPTVTRSLDFGTAVHALFEHVDWSDTTDAEQAIRQWRATVADSDDEAETHFRKAFRVPEIASALAKPEGDVTVWRERAFEAVIDDEWITGMFDRVVIVRDASGAVTNAEILDYKTNDVDEKTIITTTEHYRPQLQLYAKALAKLIRYPHDRIVCKLLFTRPGRVVRV